MMCVGLSHCFVSSSFFQCGDAPAGTGERENDEKAVDDRTVKFSPGCPEDGMVPSVVFVLWAVCAHSSTAYKCVLCSPRSPWVVQANSWLDLHWKSYFMSPEY